MEWEGSEGRDIRGGRRRRRAGERRGVKPMNRVKEAEDWEDGGVLDGRESGGPVVTHVEKVLDEELQDLRVPLDGSPVHWGVAVHIHLVYQARKFSTDLRMGWTFGRGFLSEEARVDFGVGGEVAGVARDSAMNRR